MEMTAIMAALEEGLTAYKSTNNCLSVLGALLKNGFRIVPRDYEAEARHEED